ncbi:MAG: hypothetical protein K1Y02_00575 [Candidatus Hydrogenedentes bacterium]|nr:hypothetical protein [Candidatus Hydrogenedentota bacterium]
MAQIQLLIADPVLRVTVSTMLQAEGHTVSGDTPDVILTDAIEAAHSFVERAPTLVFAAATQIRDAVAAMKQGVFGYIFLPLQPGEAEVMVRRAIGAHATKPVETVRLLEEVESEHILAVLRHCKNSRAKAAKLLGVGRNTLWRKLKRIEAARKASQQ